MDRKYATNRNFDSRMEIMAVITLQNIRNSVIKGITLNIRDGEVFVLVGPSGAGKTTLLNMVAGLAPHNGQILVDGDCVNGLPPFKRNVGYVFQDLLLFPHISVRKNIHLALQRLGVSKQEKQKRAAAYDGTPSFDAFSGAAARGVERR